jgi:hypothetical protein
MLKALCILPLLSMPAWARPPSPTEVLHGELLKRAKIRWVRQEGSRITIEINAGEAYRTNPDWNPQPVKLPYDLQKNANLEKALRSANLGPPTKTTPRRGDRTLELLLEGDKTWEVVGQWTRPARSWKKKFPAIYEQLEPLCDVQSDVFQPVKKDAAKTGDLKLTPN